MGIRVAIPSGTTGSVGRASYSIKGVARGKLWWPGLDEEIESTVRGCLPCQQNSRAPPAAPFCNWAWPVAPWSRLQLDYVSPFMGGFFLVVVDARTKWMDIHYTGGNTTTAVTVEKLRESFATHGFPDSVVTDNGTYFMSEEFQDFSCRQWGSTYPYGPLLSLIECGEKCADV